MTGPSARAVNVVDGDLVKPLIRLSVPLVLSQVLQVGDNLADTYWVGRLGQDAVSALSLRIYHREHRVISPRP